MKPNCALFCLAFLLLGQCLTAMDEPVNRDLAILEPILQKLTTNKFLKILDSEAKRDFAEILLKSGLSYENIAPKLTRFLKEGEVPFAALKKAIESEQSSMWRKAQADELTKKPDQVVLNLNQAQLHSFERDKIFKVYALCINPFRFESGRSHFEPKICEPVEGFSKPRHSNHGVSLRTLPSKRSRPNFSAYHALIEAGLEVVKNNNLNDMQIFMMAKCMAEASLRFWVPSHHPFVAVHESYKLSRRSPERAFFQEHGICSNFSGLDYNFSKALGFKSEIFLARHKVHVYLETRINGIWYHSHPFNSNSKSCDFIRFNF